MEKFSYICGSCNKKNFLFFSSSEIKELTKGRLCETACKYCNTPTRVRYISDTGYCDDVEETVEETEDYEDEPEEEVAENLTPVYWRCKHCDYENQTDFSEDEIEKLNQDYAFKIECYNCKKENEIDKSDILEYY